MAEGALGRIPPSDSRHEALYPLRAVMPQTVDHVERFLKLPYHLRPYMNQLQEGACVGASLTWMMEILNAPDPGPAKYSFFALYERAREIDEWPGTDYDGTSVRAGCDALRNEGHTPYRRGSDPWAWNPVAAAGIQANRWIASVDELRTAIALGVPVVLGLNWYERFDRPEQIGGDYWIGRGSDWGRIRGGHAICCYAASDRRQACKLTNTWGESYPLVWLPYDAVTRLLREEGEGVVPTDR